MPVPPPSRTLLSRLLQSLRWHRRMLAVVAAMGCVVVVMMSLHPNPPQTVAVVVASHQLAAGTVLSNQDLREVAYPRDQAPQLHSSIDELVGKTLTGAITQGTPLTQLSVLGSTLAHSSPGRVLAPVKLTDPELVRVLTVGTLVDVINVQGNETTVVAARARVAALPKGEAGGAFTAEGRGVLVVFDIADNEATALTRAAAEGRLAISLRS